MHRHSIWSRYGFAWVTGGFFLISLLGHWLFGWFAYVNEQQAHASRSALASTSYN